jgi:catechol 2,3-dioxygenase
MTSESIPADTRLDRLHLTISNLDRSIAFYHDSLGFSMNHREGDTAYLGTAAESFLILTEHPGRARNPRETGLYHFAVLVPSRLALAQSLDHLVKTQTPVEGFADHLVSEAIYLSDPDGNGIEIYHDRPRSEWTFTPSGQIVMATNPIDMDGVMAEIKGRTEEWNGLQPGTSLGHVHLQVASIRDSVRFFSAILGFDVMARIGPSAAFVSAGTYHHHIGMNTWAGKGAPPPPPDSIGLRYFGIRLPDAADLDKVLERIKQAGIPVEETPEGFFVRDPSQNTVLLTAPNVENAQ